MNVGFLGCGHIAQALARGWTRPGLATGQRPGLVFFDVVPARSASLADLAAGRNVATVTDLAAASDFIVLAVRPQDATSALTALSPALTDRPLVSLAAGVRVSALQRQLPQGAAVGRIMPNVNVALGRGALLFAAGSLGEDAQTVHDLFALVGEVVPIDEDLFDAATAVAGSGPGFVALFIEALERAGVEAGLSASAARTLAQAVFAGTGLLVQEEGDAAAVKRGICTPGGMTAAGVAALEERAVPAAIAAAVRAAIARAAELA